MEPEIGDKATKFGNREALLSILEGTALHIGEEFFRELVRNLAEVLQTKGAWVTEYLPEQRRLRALAFWMVDDFVDEYEYEVNGTPCEHVIDEQQLFHVADNVIELFPGDPDLEPFEAVSYLGAPLLDLDGTILGHLAVQDTKPLPEEARNLTLFNIFADRAASELRRLRAEKKLREREEQLRRLVDSAMDAMIEIDLRLNITQVNTAASKLFKCELAEKMLSKSFEQYLSADSFQKLKNLMEGLQKRPEGKRYLWIPGGLKAKNQEGELFQTEATCSCYEQNGNIYFNLVLRNITDRMEAEKRIDSLSAETEYLREEIRQIHNFDEIIGQSDAILQVLDDIRKVAGTDATVLISGKTGTGKELVARAIHVRSQRSEKPLIKVNCAAIPATLIESEFFGHEKGAFTGATESRKGRFALADGGTIFLDEVGELPIRLQPKLLRVLQEGEFEAVGSARTQQVDIRVITATNRNLQEMIQSGDFREDLYYRLNVFPISIPPLRERGNDVLLLAQAFVDRFSQKTGRSMNPLTQADILRLKSYDWPGNIRELQNIIERAVITSRDGALNLTALLPAYPGGAPKPGLPDRVLTAEELEQKERQNMMRALEETGWKVAGRNGAAELMGVPPSTFSSRMKALGINRPS